MDPCAGGEQRGSRGHYQRGHAGVRRVGSHKTFSLQQDAADRLAKPKHKPDTIGEELMPSYDIFGHDDDDTALDKQTILVQETRHLLETLQVAFDDADVDADGELTREEFNKIKPVLFRHLKHMTQAQLTHLFLKIDANCDGTLGWEEVSSVLLLAGEGELEAADGAGHEDWWPVKRVLATKEEQRNARLAEHTAHLGKVMRHEATGRYFTCSRDGAIGLWDGSFNQQMKLWNIGLKTDTHQGRPAGVADICFCGDEGQMLASGGFDRRIKVYDLVSKKEGRGKPMQLDVSLGVLEHVPMALAGWAKVNHTYDEGMTSFLAVGDEVGS